MLLPLFFFVNLQLPKCVMFGKLARGACCVGEQEKEWMGCFLDDLKAFGINADLWTTTAQAEGKLRRTEEQRAEHFMANWITAEKPGLGYDMQYSMLERNGKDQGVDTPKKAGLCWFARHHS